MSTRFSQVSRGQWPNGIDKPIAVLRAEPADLARRYRVRFKRGQDELDEFQEAGLRLKSGRQVLLTRYRRSPGPGTTVAVDRGDDATEALGELRESLELSRREFTWVSDDVEEPRSPILTTISDLFHGWLADRRNARQRSEVVEVPRSGAVHAG